MLKDAGAVGASPAATSWLLRRIAEERQKVEEVEGRIQAVVSGPVTVRGLRATEDAFREVIDHAVNRLMITGFALHNGKSVLSHLASRMDAQPLLDVTLCLDISRPPADTTDEALLIAAFARRFRDSEWPGQRWPRVYYDPRSLAHGADERSVLHAKVAIADSTRALVGSANLTEAALKRNIEIGVIVSVPSVVSLIKHHLDSLIYNNVLVPLPL